MENDLAVKSEEFQIHHKDAPVSADASIEDEKAVISEEFQGKTEPPSVYIEEEKADRSQNRKTLVNTAVAFLKNEKVKSSPLHLKKAFLQRKGLTPEEIEEAFLTSGTSLSDMGSNLSNSTLGPKSVSVEIKEESIWRKLQHFVVSTIAFTGVALALFEVFHRYIDPWLNSEARNRKEVLERLVDGQMELNENFAATVAAVNDLRRQLAKNEEGKVPNSSGEVAIVSEIKEDIKSLKAMLVSRNQFPPIPASRPILPNWQLEDKQINGNGVVSENGTKEEHKESLAVNGNGTETKHDNGEVSDEIDEE